MMSEKLCFIDVETTGLDPEANGIIQIAGMIVIDGVAIDSFNLRVQPFPNDSVDENALEVNRVTEDDLQGYPAPSFAHGELTGILGGHVNKYNSKDKLHFVAYNGNFDADFMRAWFTKCGDKYFGSWFWYPIIDVAVLAGKALMSARHELPNFKLHTVADHLGIEYDEAKLHDALADIIVTREIYEHCEVRP